MVGGLTGRQVLVTGASGFIGGRLVERLLLEEGVQVRALVHNYPSAVWLSRTGAELVPGSITQIASLRPALTGCDVVFHCAAKLGGDPEQMWHTNVAGTENVLTTARETGVSRFVHVSSLALHGPRFPHGADETSPLQPGNDPYAQTKLAAEQLVLHWGQTQGLPVVIVRPTIVYGPRSKWWTIDPIQRIKQNRLALLGKGDGIANVVYVDDVVTALLLAATRPGVVGEAFLISTEENLSWRDFFGAYAQMLQRRLPSWPKVIAALIAALTDCLDRSIAHLRRKTGLITGLRLGALVTLRGMRKAAGPLYKLGRWEIAMYSRKAQVSVAKANHLLGYHSSWPLSRAMAETERWLQMQGYLPNRPGLQQGTD